MSEHEIQFETISDLHDHPTSCNKFQQTISSSKQDEQTTRQTNDKTNKLLTIQTAIDRPKLRSEKTRTQHKSSDIYVMTSYSLYKNMKHLSKYKTRSNMAPLN